MSFQKPFRYQPKSLEICLRRTWWLCSEDILGRNEPLHGSVGYVIVIWPLIANICFADAVRSTSVAFSSDMVTVGFNLFREAVIDPRLGQDATTEDGLPLSSQGMSNSQCNYPISTRLKGLDLWGRGPTCWVGLTDGTRYQQCVFSSLSCR